jgi:hypothetical protein
MAAPGGNKHVIAGANHPENKKYSFNHAPGDGESQMVSVVRHHNEAGRFPGTGTTGGATRHHGPENASAVAASGNPDTMSQH